MSMLLLGVGGRVTGFLPSQISGMLLWFEADAITGLSDGDPITTWSDQSGQGNDATGSGATAPVYKTSIKNGQPVARCDATTKMPILGFTHAASNYTFVIAHEAGPTGGGGASYIMDVETGRFIICQDTGPNNKIGWYDGAMREGGASVQNWEILSFVMDSGGGSIFRSGVADGTPSYTQMAIGGNVMLFDHNTGGQTSVYVGDVYAIFLCDSALGTADRESLEIYVADKLGIILS